MGRMPLANAFVRPGGADEDALRFPLTLMMCRACRLIQLKETVNRDLLFKQVLWSFGASVKGQRHAAWFAQQLSQVFPSRGFLVEMMSNDGVTLEACRNEGFSVLGVDPSDVARGARQRGIPSISAFFGREVAEQIRAERGPVDVIVARHALGHLAELNDLIEGVKRLLRPGGRFVVEVPYALLMREEIQYDTIFHEHTSYWTVASLASYLERNGLQLIDLSFVPFNGGSILAHAVAAPGKARESIAQILALEEVLQLNDPAGWQLFNQRVQEQRASLRRLLQDLCRQGKRVVGYGAAAKFMVMLNYCGIDTTVLTLIGDANPRKQGLLCPGVRIPVVSPETLISAQPDYVLIGAWTLSEEIMSSFREKLAYRGKFLLPLPIAQVV